MIKSRPNDPYQNFEARFVAEIAHFNSNVTTLALHLFILAVPLLSGTNIDGAQRVLGLSSASSYETITASSTDDQIVTQFTYEKVASIMCQCD